VNAVRTPRRSARLTPEERAKLEVAIDESSRDFDRDDFEDTRVFALRLVSKRPS
jgi:hypothetical protein